jgi:hypothetical protein
VRTAAIHEAGGNPSHSGTQPLGCTSRHFTAVLSGVGAEGTTRTSKNAAGIQAALADRSLIPLLRSPEAVARTPVRNTKQWSISSTPQSVKRGFAAAPQSFFWLRFFAQNLASGRKNGDGRHFCLRRLRYQTQTW